MHLYAKKCQMRNRAYVQNKFAYSKSRLHEFMSYTVEQI